jgi:Family of unknown function (DUF5706)
VDTLQNVPIAPPNETEKAQLDFLWKQHAYISDFIKFADAKSGLIISLTLAYIAVLLSAASRFRSLLPQHFLQAVTCTQLFACMTLVCLCVSMVCAVWTVYPRLKIGPGMGPISWVEISSFSTPEMFVHASTSLSAASAVRLMARQNYYMSKVCRRKNQWIQRSLVLLIIGALISLVLLTFN